MAKRSLRTRLSRLELPGGRPELASPKKTGETRRNRLASLELKDGERTRKLPSAKAERDEKVQLEKLKKIETREKALRIIEKFKEKEKIDRAVDRDRNWKADESDRAQRSEEAIEKIDKGWKIARIGWRLVFGLTMLYFGLRGLANLIDFALNPPARAQALRFSGIWMGVALVLLGWLFQWARRKLEAYEDRDWVPYARVTLLAWIPMVALTALLFLGRIIDPSVEAFIRIAWVYFYVTLLACWYYFLTEV